MFDRRIMIIIP